MSRGKTNENPTPEHRRPDRWWIAIVVGGVAVATVTMLLVFWPDWPGSWIIIAGLGGALAVLSLHPRGWYRRRSAWCLTCAVVLAAGPAIDASFQLPPWIEGTASTTGATSVVLLLLALSCVFAVLDLISRRTEKGARPAGSVSAEATGEGAISVAGGSVTINLRSSDEMPMPIEPLTNLPQAGITFNHQFVGRGSELNALAEQLSESSVAVHHAVTSDGGFGKTALAVQFAFLAQDSFDGLWFIDASDPTTIDRHCRQIIRARDGVEPPTDKTTEELVGDVAGLLSGAKQLLILDDVVDIGWIRCFALMDPARVLVTTRQTDLPRDLIMRPMALDVLARADSIDLLRQGREDLAEDDPDLDDIAEHLASMPWR